MTPVSYNFVMDNINCLYDNLHNVQSKNYRLSESSVLFTITFFTGEIIQKQFSLKEFAAYNTEDIRQICRSFFDY